MTAPVFISHASGDKKIAFAICKVLEDNGIACWISGRDVGPGQNFQERIVRAIRAAKVMVLVFSSNANNSNEIKKELVLASQNKLTIIPVRVEDVLPNDALAYELTTCQWLEMLEDWEKATATLAECVARYAPPAKPSSENFARTTDPASAATPKPVDPSRTAEAPVSVHSAARRNPLRYYVAALLLINGALLTAFFAIPLYARPVQDAVAFVPITIILFAIASALGTIASQQWARPAGMIMCAIGAATALGFGIDSSINGFSSVLPRDPAIFIYCWLTAATFAWSFAFYIWGWRSATWPAWAANVFASPVALWVFGSTFIAVTLYTFFKTSTSIRMSFYANSFDYRIWLAALFIADVALFGYCTLRFHTESARAAGQGPTPMASTATMLGRPNPLRYYVAAYLLINGALLLIGFATSLDADRGHFQAPGSMFPVATAFCAIFLSMVVTAIGTIARKQWARFLGIAGSLLLLGFVALVVYLTSQQWMSPTYSRIATGPYFFWALTALFIYAGLVAVLLVSIVAFYVWGWDKAAWPKWAGTWPRSVRVLWGFGLLLIASSLTAYLSLATVQIFFTRALFYYAWLAALVVLDVALFGYCIRRFRREFR